MTFTHWYDVSEIQRVLSQWIAFDCLFASPRRPTASDASQSKNRTKKTEWKHRVALFHNLGLPTEPLRRASARFPRGKTRKRKVACCTHSLPSWCNPALKAGTCRGVGKEESSPKIHGLLPSANRCTSTAERTVGHSVGIAPV